MDLCALICVCPFPRADDAGARRDARTQVYRAEDDPTITPQWPHPTLYPREGELWRGPMRLQHRTSAYIG